MDNPTDLLQIKIDKAKAQLSEDTLNAIAAVPWQATILQMRETKGYTFEQLGELEIETELVLCGLLSPINYPKELENRMHLSKTEVDGLVKEMNNLVFAKIKENLVKGIEGKKVFEQKAVPIEMQETEEEKKKNDQILNSAGIEIIPEKLEITDGKAEETHPILAQKLSGYVKNDVKETDHSLNNITKTNTSNPVEVKPKIPSADPYREKPE